MDELLSELDLEDSEEVFSTDTTGRIWVCCDQCQLVNSGTALTATNYLGMFQMNILALNAPNLTTN